AGGGALRAAFDGRVESVVVVPGAALAAGEPLLVYHDTSAPRLAAYLRPDDARRVALGDECTLVPEDGGTALAARVEEIAPRLVAPPPDLAPGAGEPADLRVELHLTCEDPARLADLPLELRFKAVFGAGGRRYGS
ncbi:MAG TPA: HlyD family efflux transporter periplasmic adaptor subunit, partial [Planctomycetota bacterium]|nr:HlyD family efflux transporter periplasmic adaptor subunit [Planctomycetota bacterium]